MAPLRRQRFGDAEPALERGANDNDRVESANERLEREAASIDLVDVPAAVVCLVCGEVDCTGCEERDLSRSGIVAVVAWERPATGVLARLWGTARATTRDAETFFELLPDGPVLPALRFAFLSELIATASLVLLLVPIAFVAAPEWVRSVALDPRARLVALRLFLLGIPAFAGTLVAGHVIHGLAIDVGAARSGVRRGRSRALRFGLYSCGWDLVMGPLGVVVVAVREGANATAALTDLTTVPNRATRAFLRGCYGLEGERAARALATSTTGVVAATLIAVVAVLAGLVVLVFS